MTILVQEIPNKNAPVELLLIADPSAARILAYLPGSRCFTISSKGIVLGACVVSPLDNGTYEIMSIAVRQDQQGCGLGTTLLKWVIEYFRDAGATELLVGTGSFGHQLAFYQRQGFRVASIEHDFFIKNYPEPIFENGIQLFDMLMLSLKYREPLGGPSTDPVQNAATSG